MVALFLSFTIALFLFIWFGFFTTKFFSIESTSFEKALIGLVVVNTLTSFISIFTPISFYILLCFLTAAFLTTFYIKNELVGLYKTFCFNYPIILFSIPFLFISFSISLKEPSVYDSGLYHIQCIKWIEEYATVPGLANLHHRFGFNPIAFSLYALTSLKHFFHQEIFSINLVLFSIFTIYFIKKIHTTLKNQGVNTYFIFYSIFFYVLILLNAKISSPSPDYISSVFLLFIFIRIIEIEKLKHSVTFRTFIPTILLSTYCIMAKLSTMPICLIIAYIIYTYSTNWKEVFRISIAAMIIFFPWMINTTLLTGWLIYPFSILDLFSFDWKVPVHIVNKANAEIVGWARSPNDFYYEASQMSLIKWVPIWWGYLSGFTKLLIIGSITFPLLLWTGIWIKIIPSKRLLNICIVTSVCGIIFWFFTAPDFRFGHIFILIAFCTPLLYVDSALAFFRNISVPLKYLLLTAVLVMLLFKSIRNDYGLNTSILFYTLKNNSIVPEKIISKTVTYKYVYVGTEKIYQPVMGERCFDHQIPCSYLDASSIELRGANLNAGFRFKRQN